jgi:hypothetical protein
VEPESPLMLEIISTLGIGSLMYDRALADKFFKVTKRLASKFFQFSQNYSVKDNLYIANGLHRNAWYLGSIGKIAEAMKYNLLAKKNNRQFI